MSFANVVNVLSSVTYRISPLKDIKVIIAEVVHSCPMEAVSERQAQFSPRLLINEERFPDIAVVMTRFCND